MNNSFGVSGRSKARSQEELPNTDYNYNSNSNSNSSSMQHHHQHYSTSTASEEEIESFFLDSLMKSKCLSEQAEEEEESDEQSEINVITKLTSISTSPTSLSITTTATTTTTTTSSHFAGGLRKKSSMKSSFALTSLLQSEEDKIYSTSGKRGNINTDSNNIEPYNDNLALHTRPEGWSSPQTHFTNQQRQQQHQQPIGVGAVGRNISQQAQPQGAAGSMNIW